MKREPRRFRSNFRSVVMMGDPFSKRTGSPWRSDFGATQGHTSPFNSAIPISDQFQPSHGDYQPKQNFNCGPGDYHGGQDPAFHPSEYPQKPKSVVARESKSYRSSSFDNHHQPGFQSDHFNTEATVEDEFDHFGCTQHHER